MVYKKIYLPVILLLLNFSLNLSAKNLHNINVANSKGDTSEFNLKKFSEGIDFYGMGNEPSWAVDIAINQFIHFNTMNGITINTGSVNGEKAMDANVVRYATQTDQGFFSVTISDKECTDNMSGEKFSYKVIVEINNPGDANYKKFEGCGRYVPNYGLNRKWILKKIGEEEIVDADFQKGFPELMFDVESNMFYGNAGCNSMRGSFWSEYNLIRFADPAITMMACPNLNKEQLFIDALKKTTQYKILRNELLLSNPDNVTLIFFDPDTTTIERSGSDSDTSRVYRLNDIWVLESLNGLTIDANKYKRGLPQIEIHIKEMNFYGNGGCNVISGNIEADNNNIKFGPISSTRMMCEGINESELLTALQNVNSWNVEKNKLNLFQDGKLTVVLKKID